ncbi:MAG: septum formation family protein [Actinomycetota bacterium]|nr:septum formation family protein [Actinomycetota bacterium]
MSARRALRSAAAGVVVVLAGLTGGACSLIGTSDGSHLESVFKLQVGQCLVPPKKVQAELNSIEVVSCSTPHTQQVYALAQDHAGSTYPAPTKLDAFANAACLDHFASFDGIPYQQSKLYFTYLLPSVRSWADGDRTVVCVAETVGRPLTKSLKGAKL